MIIRWKRESSFSEYGEMRFNESRYGEGKVMEWIEMRGWMLIRRGGERNVY